MHTVADFDLAAEHVARALDVSEDTAIGFYGPGVIGTATISVDVDVHPEDWQDCITGEACAVFTSRIARNYVEIRTEGSRFPQEIADAWDHLDETYGIDDADDLGGRIFARYARLHGYTIRERSLRGYSQGDWAEVIAVEPADDSERADLDTLEDLFTGDVFIVNVSLEGPDGAPYDWSCGGIIGTDYAETEAVAEAIREIHAEIRYARNAA